MTLSLEDLARRAIEAESAADAEPYLTEAVTRSEESWEWRLVLRAIRERGDVAGALVDLVVPALEASALDALDVHGICEAASARAALLSDLDGAHALLDAGLSRFEADERDYRVSGFCWVRVAQERARLSEGRTGAEELERGVRHARRRRRVDDLCTLAGAFVKRDPDRAIALVREAEGLLDDPGQAWWVASGWRALERPDEATRLLEAALARAEEVTQAAAIARAFGEGSAGARRALTRAEALAASAGDAMAVAETAAELGLDDRVRPALARAEEAATDEERERLGALYLRLLGDEAAAARLGPRGVGPGALRSSSGLEGWASDPAGLFDRLREDIDEDRLRAIAEADYGYGADENLATLREICASGQLPRRLDFSVQEVLQLTRWQSGETVDHLARGFAVTLLCLRPDSMDRLVVNGPILLESCVSLGAGARADAAKLFAWLAGCGEGPEEAVATLLLWWLAAFDDPSDPRLPSLTEALDRPPYDLAWLAEATASDMRAELWAELLDALRERRLPPALARTVTALRR